MKKKVMSLFALALLSLLLVSCQFNPFNDSPSSNTQATPEEPIYTVEDIEKLPDEEKIQKLEELADKNMTELGYTMNSNAEFSDTVEGISFKSILTSCEKFQSLDSDDILRSKDTTISTFIENEEFKTEIESGYQEGFMYRCYDDETGSASIRSKISASDYLAFLSEDKDEIDISANSFSSIKIERKVGEGWEITASGLKGTLFEEFMELFEFYPDNETVVFSDIIAVCLISEEMKYEKFSFNAVFEETDGQTPKLFMTSEFTDYGKTKIELINLDQFTEVDDLRAIYELKDEYDDLLSADNASFVTTVYKMTEKPYIYTEMEKYTVSYTTENDKLKYDISFLSGGTSGTISYLDGIKTVNISNQEQTAESTDLLELDFIHSLLQPITFKPNTIIKSQNTGVENTYRYYVHPGSDIKEELFGTAASKYKNIVINFTVTIENGKITTIKGYLQFRLEKNTNNPWDTEETTYYQEFSVNQIVYEKNASHNS